MDGRPIEGRPPHIHLRVVCEKGQSGALSLIAFSKARSNKKVEVFSKERPEQVENQTAEECFEPMILASRVVPSLRRRFK
jgi:hypothetical protein